MTAVRVPATSANLGPGFDALGMAFSIYCDVGVVGTDELPERGAPVEPTHPAQVAFARAGGSGTVWVRNDTTNEHVSGKWVTRILFQTELELTVEQLLPYARGFWLPTCR